MPRDPLIMVAKTVKGDTSKKPSTITKTQETPVRINNLKKIERSFLSLELCTFGVFLIKWKVMENMITLNKTCRIIGEMKVIIKARGLLRKHLLPP